MTLRCYTRPLSLNIVSSPDGAKVYKLALDLIQKCLILIDTYMFFSLKQVSRLGGQNYFNVV